MCVCGRKWGKTAAGSRASSAPRGLCIPLGNLIIRLLDTVRNFNKEGVDFLGIGESAFAEAGRREMVCSAPGKYNLYFQ